MYFYTSEKYSLKMFLYHDILYDMYLFIYERLIGM